MLGRSRGQLAVDAPSALAAAVFLNGINALVINVQPLVMGALAEERGLSDASLGQVSAIFVGFNALSIISGPLWVRRVNWQAACSASTICAALILLSGGFATTLPLILVLFGLLGFVKGFLGAVSFASLGDGDNPDRAYAMAVVSQSLLAAVAAIPLSSWVIPRFGVAGLFSALGLVVASGLFACLFMPAKGAPRHSTIVANLAPLKSALAMPAWIALLASVLFIAGIIGFWFFMERIGAARGASPTIIGLAVSLSALATILTASLAAWLGGRFSTMAFVVGGSSFVLGGYALLLAPGSAAYVAGVLLFALGWGLAQPAYWAALSKVDATGRLFVAAPGAAGVAGVFIGLIAGPIIARAGYGGLIGFSAALIVAGIIAVTIAMRAAQSPACSFTATTVPDSQ